MQPEEGAEANHSHTQTQRHTQTHTDSWGSWGARFKARIERMIARLSQYLLSGPRALAQQPLSTAARLPDWQQPQTPTRPAGLAVEHGTARTPEPGRPPPNLSPPRLAYRTGSSRRHLQGPQALPWSTARPGPQSPAARLLTHSRVWASSPRPLLYLSRGPHGTPRLVLPVNVATAE